MLDINMDLSFDLRWLCGSVVGLVRAVDAIRL